MTVILYDYHELEDRPGKHLKVWKGWHVTLFILAGIFGLLNYTFFQSTENLFDDNCILFPRKLEFRSVLLPPSEIDKLRNSEGNVFNETDVIPTDVITNDGSEKREASDESIIQNNSFDNNSSSYNETTRLVLNMRRSLFEMETECQFAMFMPVLATVFAFVWATLFTMCPGGGYSRFGLSQPWRILTPALLFSIVMVGLTGHSFSQTNTGLQALCASFSNVTNTTACSAVNSHVEKAWNVTWQIGARVSATRAASAGVWATWACACALLLARCLAAPDFVVKRTQIVLKDDPAKKITPYLKRSPKKSPSLKNARVKTSSQTSQGSPSIKSEPTTFTTAVVTPSPVKQKERSTNNHERDELMELVYIPQN